MTTKTDGARTSRPVNRPAKPKQSSRAQTGNAAAESRLTTLEDYATTTGRAILVHGPSGSGKTVLAIHKAPRPTLVLDCDNGLDSVLGTNDMRGVKLWKPGDGRVHYNWEDLDEFRNYVKAGDWIDDYKAIVVDNTTTAQKPIIRSVIDDMIERAQQKKATGDDEDDTGIDPDNPSRQGWGKIYRRIDTWVTDIRDAKRRGPHVIFTAGTSEWMDTQEGYSRLMPDIEGKERNQIATHFDAVMWLEADEDGRRLYVAPQGAFITKVRLPVSRHGDVPDIIEDPEFDDMIKAAKLVEGRTQKAASSKASSGKRKPRKPATKRSGN